MEQIVIKPEMIILKGVTTQATLGNKHYIVYQADDGVSITGNDFEWGPKNNNVIIPVSYTRRLAKSLEDFYRISMSEIENQAYGAYMDGAHF